MSRRRLFKFEILFALAVVILAVGASAPGAPFARLAAPAPQQELCAASGPDGALAAEIRAEIPSDFVQPLLSCEGSQALSLEGFRAAMPHTIRDEIPAEFIQPSGAGDLQDYAQHSP